MYADNPLHRARLGRGIPVSDLAARTCLSPRIVQQIDTGQFDQLPGGLYARSYVRTFAAAVGLDPDGIVRELSERLPPDEDPFPALRENARAHMPAWVASVTEWPGRAIAWTSAIYPAAQQPPRFSRLAAARCAAVLVDAGVLFLLYALFIRMTAWSLDVNVDEAMEHAAVAVAAPWAALALLYFVMLGGVAGRTLGAAVCGLRAPRPNEPLNPRSICLRAFSLTADWRSHQTAESTEQWHTESQSLDTADSHG